MKSITRWVCSPMKQRDELFSNAEHEAVPMMRFASSGNMSLQRARGGEVGVAGCALWLLLPTGGRRGTATP